jgi:hypothetical protein
MSIICIMFRLHHHGGNMGRIQVANSKFIVLHWYVDGATSQEESHHINVDSLGGRNTGKGVVSNSSGRDKENRSHLKGKNQ